jgi:hypothetical protein
MIIDFDSFTTTQFERYLEKNGWTNQEGMWKKEWEDEGRYINIPHRNCSMYEESMFYILEVISDGEQKDMSKVIEDIQVN